MSNHNSFPVLFDKIASVYYIWKIYLYFSIGNGQPTEPALCQLFRHTYIPYLINGVRLATRVYAPNGVSLGPGAQAPKSWLAPQI